MNVRIIGYILLILSLGLVAMDVFSYESREESLTVVQQKCLDYYYPLLVQCKEMPCLRKVVRESSLQCVYPFPITDVYNK